MRQIKGQAKRECVEIVMVFTLKPKSPSLCQAIIKS